MNSEDYVRKEIFDLEISRLQSIIDNQAKRIDDLQNSFNRYTAFVGVAIGLFALLLTGVQVAIAFAPLIISAVK